MNKTFLGLAAAVAFLWAGCTSIVSADRNKIPDNLYQPTTGTGGATGGGLGGEGGSEVDAAQDAENSGDAATETGGGGDAGEVGASDVLGDVSQPDVNPGG